MNIAKNIERGHRLFPDKTAILFEGKAISYKALDEMANRFANGLRGLSIGKGDRVALFLPNIPEFAVAYLGTQKIGAISVSLNSALKTEEVAFILNDCKASVLVTTVLLSEIVPVSGLPHLRHIVAAEGITVRGASLNELTSRSSPNAVAVSMKEDDPAAILYTSGTTGFPKGVTLSHGNVVSNMHAKVRYCGMRPDDRILLFVPLFHCFGQNAVLNSGLDAGATIVLHRHFDPDQVIRSVREDKITMFFGVPTTFILLYDRASVQDMGFVRYCLSAAASLPVEIAGRWQEKFGVVINEGYGLTETSPFACYNHHRRHKPGSIGMPIENVSMRVIAPDDGREAAPGELGEIVIRGPNVMLGYWNRPSETAQAIRDGWLHTGDIGRIDGEGYFYLVDRVKDMINVGGLKVYPAEVENVLFQHPAVADAAVYGVQDSIMGEQVMASVVLKQGHSATAEDIIAFSLKRIAGFKTPSTVEFVGNIPRNPAGKPLRRVLRDGKSRIRPTADVSTRPGHCRIAPTADAIQDWMANWLAGKLGIDAGAIDPGRSFFDYGLNSMFVVNLTRDLGNWLGHALEAVIAWKFPTIESLACHLERELNAPPLARTEDAGQPFPMNEESPLIPIRDSGNREDGRPELWPSVAEYFVYDEFLYYALTNDERRNRSYRAAIGRLVKDKVVVEVGTGKDAVLSRFCVEAGARKVYAIELNAEPYRLASACIKKHGMSDKITLIHGDATRVSVPELADVCLSEIVGSIGGCEGAAVIMNSARRFLKEGGNMIPRRSVTRIAPVCLPDELLQNPGFTRIPGHYTEKIFQQVGYPFDLRLCVKNFPKSHLLSKGEIFEDIDFTAPIATEYSHEVRFTISQDGRLDGFLVWLNLHTIEGEVIDILEHEYSWLPVYFPVFYPGVAVTAGDAIHAICMGTLCENNLNPDYKVKGRLTRKNGETIEFEHASYHHKKLFRQTPFYERLFVQDGGKTSLRGIPNDSPSRPQSRCAAPVNTASCPELPPADTEAMPDLKALSRDEMAALLAREIEAARQRKTP